MLLPSFSWLSHHQSMPFCRNWIVIMGVTHVSAL
jgi:hypothetical protein